MSEKVIRIFLVLMLTGLFLAWFPKSAVYADAPISPPMQDEEPPADADADKPGPIAQIIESLVTHVVKISAPSLLDAFNFVMVRMNNEAVEQFEQPLQKVAKAAFDIFFRFDSNGLRGMDDSLYVVTQDLWKLTFKISTLLFALVLGLNFLAVFMGGHSASVARAEAFQVLIETGGALLFAAASFIIATYAIRVGWGITGAVLDQVASSAQGPNMETIVDSITSGLVRTALSLATININSGGIISTFNMVFNISMIILALMVFAALALSYYAIITITIGLVVVAPLIIALGAVDQFRWVYGTWTKLFGGVLLIPLADAILIKGWSLFAVNIVNGDDALVDSLVGIGILCIIVTVNFGLGKLIYSPAIEAVKSTIGAMKAITGVAIAALGGMGAGAVLGGSMSSGVSSPELSSGGNDGGITGVGTTPAQLQSGGNGGQGMPALPSPSQSSTPAFGRYSPGRAAQAESIMRTSGALARAVGGNTGAAAASMFQHPAQSRINEDKADTSAAYREEGRQARLQGNDEKNNGGGQRTVAAPNQPYQPTPQNATGFKPMAQRITGLEPAVQTDNAFQQGGISGAGLENSFSRMNGSINTHASSRGMPANMALDDVSRYSHDGSTINPEDFQGAVVTLTQPAYNPQPGWMTDTQAKGIVNSVAQQGKGDSVIGDFADAFIMQYNNHTGERGSSGFWNNLNGLF